MSSSTLFKIAAVGFAAMPLGHTQMFYEILSPGLKPLGKTATGNSVKISWTQANGYFITTALLCFKWAQTGIDLKSGIDRYVLATLLATQISAGIAYLKMGPPSPAGAYGVLSLLMAIAAYKA